MNEPYSGRAGLIYSAARHASAHGKRALELEVRQDLALEARVRAQVTGALGQLATKLH
jgi:predicted N-formylglutamate amidohydrolase